MFTSKLLVVLMVIALFFPVAKAQVSHIVINAIYGGGNNTGAIYSNDFVELFNPSTNADTLTNWSVQYASNAAVSWAIQSFTTIIPAGGYYLLQFNGGVGIAPSLPTADVIGTTNLNATGGKVALVNCSTGLYGDDVTGISTIDFVGYGTTATGFETLPAPTPSNKKCLIRINAGCTDLNDNSNDFVTSAVYVPHNSLSPVNICGGMPVIMKSFSVSSNNIGREAKLNWETSTEINFSHFELEKAIVGNKFFELATVISNNIVSGSVYTYSDKNIEAENIYYRLKLIDNNGSFSYSSVVALNKGKVDANIIRVLTNPVFNMLVIEHPNTVLGGRIEISGIDGKAFLLFNVLAGTNKSEIDVSKIRSGNYIVSYKDKSNSKAMMFIKQ